MNQGDRATDEWPAEHDYCELGQFDLRKIVPAPAPSLFWVGVGLMVVALGLAAWVLG